MSGTTHNAPLIDLELAIIDLSGAYHALYAMADNSATNSEMQRVLQFLAVSLHHIHNNLREKYDAVRTAGRDSTPTPLHGV